MRKSRWLRLLAYVTGSVNQELLLRNEYLAVGNRILRTKLPARLRLSNPEQITLAEIGKRLGRTRLPFGNTRLVDQVATQQDSIRRSPNVFQPKGACMLRAERSGNGQVLFTLSGRIEGEIQELQRLIASEKSGQHLIFNLRDVTLVNQDAVKFLAHCEAHGITLEHCPLHIRTWIDQVKGRPRRRQT